MRLGVTGQQLIDPLHLGYLALLLGLHDAGQFGVPHGSFVSCRHGFVDHRRR